MHGLFAFYKQLQGVAKGDINGCTINFHAKYLVMSRRINLPRKFYIGLKQRFVSTTRNIEVLLSHTHSIVCDNDIGGLFLGCSKSCKMAAHNLKIHFNSLFMILHKKVSKMFRRVFSLIKKYVL